jgi:MFS family permease
VIIQFGVDRVRPSTTSSLHRDSHAPKIRVLNKGLLSAATATFMMASAFSLMTTLENEFNSRLHMNAFHFAIAFSSLMLSRLIFQIPSGRLSDRFGRRPFVIGGLLLIGPVTALLGEVATLWQLVVLRFIQGLAAASIVAPSLAYAGDMAQSSGHNQHATQMSIVTTGFGLGIAFGPLIAGFLGIFSFELPFMVDGALCVLGAFMVYLFMTETVRR